MTLGLPALTVREHGANGHNIIECDYNEVVELDSAAEGFSRSSYDER